MPSPPSAVPSSPPAPAGVHRLGGVEARGHRGLRRLTRGVALGVALAVLVACATQPSLPLGPRAAQGLTVLRSLPKALPEGADPLPARQLVLLVPASTAQGAASTVLDLLIPVPYVSDAIVGAVTGVGHGQALQRKAQQFDGVDPHAAVLEALRGSTLQVTVPPADAAASAPAPAGLTLQPFAFVQGCDDGRFRLALVAHLQDGDWVGRYTVHLDRSLSQAEFDAPDAAAIADVRAGLAEAAGQLRTLLERAARGDLRPSGTRVNVGSLHLFGNRPPGTFMSPTSMVARDGDLIEEAPDHVIVRLSGDLTQSAALGGLVFGVHWLRRDQLHTFETRPATASARP